MSARLASLAAVVLVLIAVTSPAGALSERERADRIFDVAAPCALLLKGVDPDPDEGRRMATDLLAKLESEVGDPRPVWDELRLQSPQCLSILNRPTVSAESKPERSPEPTSTGGQVDAPAAPTDGPAAAIQAQVEASPEVVAEAKPESPPPVPSPAAPTEPSVAQPAAPAEPAPATPPVSASLAPPVAVEAPPSSAAPPTAAPVPPIRPKLTRHGEVTPADLRPAAALTIVNGREVEATSVIVSAEAKTVRHSEPLASRAKAVLKLPKLKGCVVTVTATFEGGETSEVGDIDLCKVKLVRLTD